MTHSAPRSHDSRDRRIRKKHDLTSVYQIKNQSDLPNEHFRSRWHVTKQMTLVSCQVSASAMDRCRRILSRTSNEDQGLPTHSMITLLRWRRSKNNVKRKGADVKVRNATLLWHVALATNSAHFS